MISDAFGAGVEWETVTPFTDEETIVSSEGSGERSSAATASYGHNGVRTPTFRAPVGHGRRASCDRPARNPAPAKRSKERERDGTRTRDLRRDRPRRREVVATTPDDGARAIRLVMRDRGRSDACMHGSGWVLAGTFGTRLARDPSPNDHQRHAESTRSAHSGVRETRAAGLEPA